MSNSFNQIGCICEKKCVGMGATASTQKAQLENIIERYKPPILAGFGNPLLDICATVTNSEALEEYGLKANGIEEVSTKTEIFQEIRESSDVEFHAGGAAQNTLRIFQWLLNRPNYSVFFGGLGTDEDGKQLQKLVEESGVQTRYAFHDDYPTGSCVTLITGEERSLVAYLGAANVYEPAHLNAPGNIELLGKAEIVYIESFFISHSYAAACEILQLCQRRKIMLAFNINAVYICKKFPNEVSHMVKNCNILFGNKEEFRALSEAMDLGFSTVEDIAIALQKMKPPINESHGDLSEPVIFAHLQKIDKVVVVTDGKDPVFCVYGKDSTTINYVVPVLEARKIKDTSGAGDSFVAGFLAAAFAGHCVGTCIAWGCWTARQIIQLVGCQVPTYPPDEVYKLKL